MEWSDFNRILSAATLLFLVMDPLGNLPLFVGLLKRQDAAAYRRIVLRESLVALAVLLLFLFFGDMILRLFQISQPSLGIGGGVILFLIALKMVFGMPQFGEERVSQEPFIVPLAVPLVAGPSAITVVILLRGNSLHTIFAAVGALLLAWGATTLILLVGRRLAAKLGVRVLDAFESLMGFLLTVIAVEMLITGIRAAFFK